MKTFFPNDPERKKLVAQVELLEQEAQAESDFAVALPTEENPWSGSAGRLEAAKATLSSLDEATRLERFRQLVNRYRGAHETLNDESLISQLREIEQRQRDLGGYTLRMKGALHRHGHPTSERDAEERQNTLAIKELDADRTRLASRLDGAADMLRQIETDFPFMRTYRSYLQAAS